MARDEGGTFTADVPDGTVYGLVAEGDGPRFDPSKLLLDPWATEVWFPPAHDRRLATPGRASTPPGAVRWRSPAMSRVPRPPRPSSRGPVVYEAHVRGFTRGKDVAEPGTYAALVAELPRLAALGVTRRRAAARAPERPAGGQLLGLHAAGVRCRAPPVRGGGRRRGGAGRLRRRGPRPRHRGVAGRRLQPHDRGRRRHRADVQPARPRRRVVLPAARRRLVHRDDGVRQRHRRDVARRPGPRALVARPPRRPRRRRVPLRPGRRAGPRPRLRRRPRRRGRPDEAS